MQPTDPSPPPDFEEIDTSSLDQPAPAQVTFPTSFVVTRPGEELTVLSLSSRDPVQPGETWTEYVTTNGLLTRLGVAFVSDDTARDGLFFTSIEVGYLQMLLGHPAMVPTSAFSQDDRRQVHARDLLVGKLLDPGQPLRFSGVNHDVVPRHFRVTVLAYYLPERFAYQRHDVFSERSFNQDLLWCRRMGIDPERSFNQDLRWCRRMGIDPECDWDDGGSDGAEFDVKAADDGSSTDGGGI